MGINIRRALPDDMEGINSLLYQVLTVHHNGRPDLFKANVKKYTDEQLLEIIRDDSKPIFVAEDEDGNVAGYAFCVFQKHEDSNVLTDIRTICRDNLCVDEALRRQHIGKCLYEYVLDFARESGCYNVTLNVWWCNEADVRCYEKYGLKPQKVGMEIIL